jgi:Putative MetA-pathway of phenol degradation
MKKSGSLRVAMGLMIGLCCATPAWAGDYCPDRPGMNTPPCVIERGHVSAEASFADWTHDKSAASVDDQLLIGDLALRYGVAKHAELRLAWTSFGHLRSRDRVTGLVDSASGVGDVTIGVKRNLLGLDGAGFALAVVPSITLPTGGAALGAGDWHGGLQVAMAGPVGHGISWMLTPEVDAAVNGSGNGRHLAYGSAGGLGFTLGAKLNLSVEAQVMRDDDPSGVITTAQAGAALAFAARDNMQFDLGTVFGLNANTPDFRIYVGIARHF